MKPAGTIAHAQLKLSAAKEIAPFYRALTPSSLKPGCAAENKITWRQWWEKRFKDDYAKFVRENFEHFKPRSQQNDHSPTALDCAAIPPR